MYIVLCSISRRRYQGIHHRRNHEKTLINQYESDFRRPPWRNPAGGWVFFVYRAQLVVISPDMLEKNRRWLF